MSFFSALGRALKSRTVWAGIGSTALGVGQLAAQYAPAILSFVPPATPLAAGITAGLGVLTIIGRLRAKQPLGPVIDQTIAQSISAVTAIKGEPPVGIKTVDAVTAAVKKQPGAINKAVTTGGMGAAH